ncbi:c-type cytochrome biogenesis protein CcmI [Chelatococcus reniformis]|uniref:Cytochrome c-type biogenesis protein CycH n=1 Tax=Chelatococcus reniformis TaxID=1494448 RepID=A0A916XI25_9HYPH|nr:c-type cytochrome biogenesis protein CcmI [Chelatococcus reniformis]GGC73585.1 cytochrome c-type biogenesis protein CycH [Chelatococcus reniformis]
MTIWLAFAVMTGIAVLAVLWPLSRRLPTRAGAVDQTAFYAAQLAEIDRDLGRGLLEPGEADAARAEAARRLIRASAGAAPATGGDSEPALRRRRAASAVALSTIPLVAIAVYGAVGSPGLPAQPLAAREAPRAGGMGMAEAVARVEAHLARDPADGRGWDVLAPVYLKSGRAGDAVRAYENAIRLLGETPDRLAAYGEALVAAANGVVEKAARRVFERGLAGDPKSAKAQFYLALAAEQDGRPDEAATRLSALIASAPPGAPWRSTVEAKLAALSAPAASAAIANLPASEQKAAIAGMVEGLAQRLAQDGNDAQGWLRLVRSYVVLGDQAKAVVAVQAGKRALAARPADVAGLEGLARELGLVEPAAKP